MKRSIKVASKKRGRPPTGGRDPGVHVRLPETMLVAIDAKSDEEGTSRSEAIRRLVELGLTAQPNGRAASDSQKLKAREMAAATIDKIADDDVGSEDHVSRKRRLIKGPEEFEAVRVDRPKKK